MLRSDLNRPGTVYHYSSEPRATFAVNNVRLPGAPTPTRNECSPSWTSPVTMVWSPPETPPEVTEQPHYASLDPEPIDVIEKWGLNFRLSSVLKYIARAGRKGDEKDHKRDLEKAISYLRREINALDGKHSWE